MFPQSNHAAMPAVAAVAAVRAVSRRAVRVLAMAANRRAAPGGPLLVRRWVFAPALAGPLADGGSACTNSSYRFAPFISHGLRLDLPQDRRQ